jgi:hypothetical protein
MHRDESDQQVLDALALTGAVSYAGALFYTLIKQW